MDGSLNASHVPLRKSKSGGLRFSYFRTTEQNRHGFVQFASLYVVKALFAPNILQFDSQKRRIKMLERIENVNEQVIEKMLLLLYAESMADMEGEFWG